jgi:hypothetical protein
MPKLKEITKEKKSKNILGGNPIRSFLLQASPPFARRYPIIDNIFLYYNLVEHYFPPFLPKKKAIKNIIKCFIILDVH